MPDEPDTDDGADTSQLHMHIRDLTRGVATPDGFVPIVQHTTRGDIEARFYPASAATAAVIFVGGIGGGFDSPIGGRLYPQLCQSLAREGISGLRVRFRDSHDFQEAVLDVLAGVSFLEAEDVKRIALVGHSFGGAVVIQAAALSPRVVTCATLATQAAGAQPAATLGPRCSLLAAHGTADEILPDTCSTWVHKIAAEPKRLLLKDGVGHGLDEWADELPAIVHEWLVRELRRDA